MFNKPFFVARQKARVFFVVKRKKKVKSLDEKLYPPSVDKIEDRIFFEKLSLKRYQLLLSRSNTSSLPFLWHQCVYSQCVDPQRFCCICIFCTIRN